MFEHLKLEKFYFTFGSGQKHENHFIIIKSTSADLARKKMIDLFEREWSSQYSEEEWFENGVSQQEKYNYKELKIVS